MCWYHGNVMVSEGNIHVNSVHMTFSGIPWCYHVHTVLLLYFNKPSKPHPQHKLSDIFCINYFKLKWL